MQIRSQFPALEIVYQFRFMDNYVQKMRIVVTWIILDFVIIFINGSNLIHSFISNSI